MKSNVHRFMGWRWMIGCAVMVASVETHAVVNAIITKTQYAAPGPITSLFTASATDLVNAGQPSLGTVTFVSPPANGACLNNGNVGVDGTLTSPAYNATLGGFTGMSGNTVTFDLVGTSGYDILRIDCYNGDVDHASCGRQVYNAYYSLVGEPGWRPIVDESFLVNTMGTPGEGDDVYHPTATFNNYARTSLTALTGTTVPIATHVDGIRLVFGPGTIMSDTGFNWYGGVNNYWREIDVLGVASPEVPEPAAGFLAAGLLAALCGRRRRTTV